MDSISVQFLNDPMVAPLWGLLVLSVADFALGVYRAFQTSTFDWAKLPAILDTVVLQKVVPLAVLGIAAFMVTDASVKSALTIAYVGGCAAAIAAQANALITKIRPAPAA